LNKFLFEAGLVAVKCYSRSLNSPERQQSLKNIIGCTVKLLPLRLKGQTVLKPVVG
jgi:hypothetical protein